MSTTGTTTMDKTKANRGAVSHKETLQHQRLLLDHLLVPYREHPVGLYGKHSTTVPDRHQFLVYMIVLSLKVSFYKGTLIQMRFRIH